MRDTGRTGFYASVIEPGTLQAGDVIERVATNASRPTVLALHQRTSVD